jgi:hypothetical protein
MYFHGSVPPHPRGGRRGNKGDCDECLLEGTCERCKGAGLCKSADCKGGFHGYFGADTWEVPPANIPTDQFLQLMTPAGSTTSYISRGAPVQPQGQQSQWLWPAIALGGALVLFTVMR